jgi:excisionase family DNA binding protein
MGKTGGIMQIIESFNSTTLVPSESDSEMTRVASKKLSHFNKTKKVSLNIISEDKTQESIEIPDQVYKMLVEIFSQVSEGKTVSLVSSQSELTTQEASEYLNVSRPFLVKILEQGAMPFRKVGKHRRIQISDLIRYKNSIMENREKDLEELSHQAQELKMGYEK